MSKASHFARTAAFFDAYGADTLSEAASEKYHRRVDKFQRDAMRHAERRMKADARRAAAED